MTDRSKIREQMMDLGIGAGAVILIGAFLIGGVSHHYDGILLPSSGLDPVEIFLMACQWVFLAGLSGMIGLALAQLGKLIRRSALLPVSVSLSLTLVVASLGVIALYVALLLLRIS